jgi:hypothetical protein
MSDKREDGKDPGAEPATPEQKPAPLTRRGAFKRIASTLMGGVALAVGGPLIPKEARAIYYSRYSSSYYSRYSSYYSRYSSYFSRYSSYYSRYSSYFSRYNSYSSRYSSYFSRYNSYSSRYNSVSRQQEWHRQDVYRSQQNQVVKDSIRKQTEQQNRNRYTSTAYQSRYSSMYNSRAAYTSRATPGYTSRFTPSYTSHAYNSRGYVSQAAAAHKPPAYTSRASAYTSRAPAYTSRAYVSHAAPPAHQKTPPHKAKTSYSSWYCSQGFWHRYSSLA